ncbi:hypothetical protein NP233_g4774 [Leucocoprinus birnbaumii]|uniref:Ribosomal RNA-processing protein 17 n=1 Tax=Leucocoprinus birnbaumii TaxID=56174 RepID=A0AAD5VWR8_9AGAR|nr:hypothetical protein NP233_g4774 [Leucocoprinus birnbaumii]
MDNLASLTRSHTLIAAKKRAKRQQIPQVIFDEDARREFLTGFHKRKLAKADAARKKAQEREKQDRLESRREQRRALREQAAENARKVESAYADIYGQGADDDDDVEEWSGINDKGKQRDEEYEDDHVLATVTVVEDFDPDAIRHGPLKSSPPTPPISDPPSNLPRTNAKSTPQPTRPPKKTNKSQKIRYQTKEARKNERVKQFARRTEKAERAGGKAARSRNSSKKKPKARR